ncbi:MAG: hypothetical protein QQN63_00835 [Nitrosopumilus sp.]
MVKKVILQKHIDRVQNARDQLFREAAYLFDLKKRNGVDKQEQLVKTWKESLEKREDKLRGLAITDYEKRGNRQPMPGIDIREINEVYIGEEDDLIKWCYDHRIFAKVDRVKIRKFILQFPEEHIPHTSSQKKTIVALASKFEVPGEEE